MKKHMKYLLSLLLVLGFAVQGRATTVSIEYWDTTIFNTTAPWTTPAEDYVSRTFGNATFLSADPPSFFFDDWDPDGICWIQHFTPPSSYDGMVCGQLSILTSTMMMGAIVEHLQLSGAPSRSTATI